MTDIISKSTQPEIHRTCLEYVNSLWNDLTFTSKSSGVRIGLPHPYISPNAEKFSGDQFYWDSYFIILGLIATNQVPLAKGMVDNLAFLYRKFRIIPSRNRLYNLGISQPPFLTSMALAVYEKDFDKKWLSKIALIAEKELSEYWLDNNDDKKDKHLVFKGLSRYRDHFATHTTSEHESGWDMTSRFNEHCMNFVPIDLNSCLYKYETDLAYIFSITGNTEKNQYYMTRAQKRASQIRACMWDESKGFYFDYNYKNNQMSDFYSLASFYPLWAKMATQEEASLIKENIVRFEYAGGLANTQKENLATEFKQWDYPNGWAPQQWIVIKGLLNYGFEEDAKRIARKWLNLNISVFNKTGKIWERYDVINLKEGSPERYPIQSGFAWTNAVFILLSEILDK